MDPSYIYHTFDNSDHGHLFLSAKGQRAGGADKAGGPDDAAGTDQTCEGITRGCRRGGRGGRGGRGPDLGLGHNLLRGRDEAVDLTPELRRQVLGLSLTLREEPVELALDLGKHRPGVWLAGRGQDAVDLGPDGGWHARVAGQLLRVTEEAGEGAGVGGSSRLSGLSCTSCGEVVGTEGEVGADCRVDSGWELELGGGGEPKLGGGGSHAHGGREEHHKESLFAKGQVVGYVN